MKMMMMIIIIIIHSKIEIGAIFTLFTLDIQMYYSGKTQPIRHLFTLKVYYKNYDRVRNYSAILCKHVKYKMGKILLCT